jgi:PAS domain S-box-containing protein
VHPFAPGIRAHLVGLVCAAVVPVLAFSTVMAVVFWHQQRAGFEQRFLERARSMTIALDREQEASIRALETLAVAAELDGGDYRKFAEHARRVLRAGAGWTTIVLATPDGEQVVNLAHPGVRLPKLSGRPYFKQALQTARPAISRLQNSLLADRWMTGVAVPVIRDGAVRYVLCAGIDQAVWRRFLALYPVAPDATMTLLDQDGTIIARTRDHDRLEGKRLSPLHYENVGRAPEAAYVGAGLEGGRIYAAHARSSVSGWTVATEVPAARVERAIWRPVVVMAGGGGFALLLAVGLAPLFGRRIAAQVSTLARRATAVTRDDVPTSPEVTITEVADVARAFDGATAELRAREAALRAGRQLADEQLAEIEAIYQTAPIGLCVLDTSLRFVRINERLAEMDGLPAAAHIGRTVREITPDIADVVESIMRNVLTTGVAVLDYEITGEKRAGPGVSRAWLASWLPLRAADGRIVGINVVAEEITERKRAEDERATLLVAAQAASRDAEEANRLKDEFLAMLGHELRNPLGAISSAVHVMAKIDSAHPRAAQARAIAHRQVGHLARLVEDLLDVSRVAGGKIQLERRPLNLRAVVTDAVATLTTSGQTARHEISVRAQDAWVAADETRLEQIVSNLLGNAVKYTPPGGRIGIDVEPAGDEVVLRVADTGIGIAADVLPRVFDLFVQAPRTLERGQGGLGIGLTLVRRLVELHGGRVDAQSAGPAHGSVFTVALPRIPAPRLVVAAPEKTPRREIGRRRILIVEDNEDAREMMRQALELAGHEVHVCEDGPSGVDAARELRPDVALVDIGLPGEDGYSVAGRIRDLPAGREMLLIAVTGYGQADDRRRAKDAGFDLHVAKPVDPFRLLELIRAETRSAA